MAAKTCRRCSGRGQVIIREKTEKLVNGQLITKQETRIEDCSSCGGYGWK